MGSGIGRAARGAITRRDIVCCFSLANLLTLPLWVQLFTLTDPRLEYYRPHTVDPRLLVYGCFAAVAGTVCLTAAFTALLRVIQPMRNGQLMPLLRAAACGILAIPVYVIARMQLFPATGRILIAVLAGIAILIAADRRFGRVAAGIGTAAVAIMWPLAIITPASFVWRISSRPSDAVFANTKTVPVSSSAPAGGQRLIWIIFDELDQELLFRLRPSRIQLPEFDGLRSQALQATDAISPADYTAIAFPALTIGRVVRSVVPEGPTRLRVNLADGQSENWAQLPNLFRQARDSGFNVGLVGWHHPFCRLFGDVLSSCMWEPNLDAYSTLRHEYVYGSMPDGLVRFADYLMTARRGGPRVTASEYRAVAAEQRRQLERLRDTALELVADARYGFLMLHFPVPHPPSVSEHGGGNYFDNLVVADMILGQLRHKLTSAGMWDDTALLVMGDHPLRVSVWELRPTWTAEEAESARRRNALRVPFLLRMPGQENAVRYERPLDTILTHDLILEILHGRLKHPDAVVKWMQSRATP